MAGELCVPGYTVVERRRDKGRRGGLAILVRKSLKILSENSNEYALQVQLGLPDGQRATITNVYLPPSTSLLRRHVSDKTAQAAVQEIVTSAPATKFVITCGDFNSRCGTRAPTVGGVQLPRSSMDSKECHRAPWLVHLAELAELHILNGKEPQKPA